MPRQRSPKRDMAFRLWLDSGKTRKLKDIAAELEVSESQVRKWKNQDGWNGNVTNETKGNVTKRRGAQKGNKNAAGHGAPQKNNNAEKFGFFRKYLPEETVSIMEEMPEDPLDILWHEVQIAYAAIIRAQQIMYVKDRNDKTIEKVEERKGKIVGEKWDVQQAWDKQGNFLAAQARAMSDLRSSIRQYEELLHKNWGLATEEQKARIEQVKAKTKTLSGGNGADEALDRLDKILEGLNNAAANDKETE